MNIVRCSRSADQGGAIKRGELLAVRSTGEAVASSDISGLFSGFESATSENTRRSTFEIKQGPIQGLGLWSHITGGLAAIMGLFGAPFNVSGEEAINSGAQTPGTRTHISGTLTTLARALVIWRLCSTTFGSPSAASLITELHRRTPTGSLKPLAAVPTPKTGLRLRQYQLQISRTVAATA